MKIRAFWGPARAGGMRVRAPRQWVTGYHYRSRAVQSILDLCFSFACTRLRFLSRGNVSYPVALPLMTTTYASVASRQCVAVGPGLTYTSVTGLTGGHLDDATIQSEGTHNGTDFRKGLPVAHHRGHFRDSRPPAHQRVSRKVFHAKVTYSATSSSLRHNPPTATICLVACHRGGRHGWTRHRNGGPGV